MQRKNGDAVEIARPVTAQDGSSPQDMRLVVAATLTASTVLTLVLVDEVGLDPEALILLAVAGALFLAGGLSTPGARILDRFGGVFLAAVVAGIVALGGGYAVALHSVLALLVVFDAAVRPLRRLVVDSVAVLAAVLAPFVYSEPGRALVAEALVEVLVWVALVVLVRMLTARLRLSDVALLRLQSALDASEDLIMVTHPAENRIVYANRAAAVVTGGAAVTGGSIDAVAAASLTPPDRMERKRAELRRNGAIRDTFVWADSDGVEREIDSVSRFIRSDPEGAVITVGRDVTERRQIERVRQLVLEQKEEAAGQLAATVRMQRTFLQAVSHELRTPLTAVIGFAETLLSHRAGLDDRQVELLLARTLSNAQRLEQLLADLLDLARLNRGGIDPDRTDVDLTQLCHTVVGQIDASDHHIVLDVPPRLIADLDGPKVERAVENLLRNAVRHTPAGTRIELRATEAPGGVRILVVDDGPGVPRAYQDHIFEPFQQGPEAASSPSPGTGIGLAIVDQFAQLHGGRAWYADRPGGGAVFGLFLPTPREPQDPPGARATVGARDERPDAG